ncbi:hypothetical protein [Nocardioides sp. 1609]|uniref:hypothetical protein n=1 Tax=Nocardioides sp. 1609 TaxID=2508327 RepID=UPI001430772C|nr:hypothetical protein [Nocardioides sp. 1609]
MTAGLSASAAVLAMAVQAGAFEDDGAVGPSYGDSAAAEPDRGPDDGPDDGADAGAE